MTLSYRLTERLGVNLNASQQTSGYRELSDALQKNGQSTPHRSRNHWGVGINWAEQRLGHFSMTWARSTTFMRERFDYWRAGWSRQIQRVYLGVSLQHNTGTRSGFSDNRVYVSLNLPLGEGRVILAVILTVQVTTIIALVCITANVPVRIWGGTCLLTRIFNAILRQ